MNKDDIDKIRQIKQYLIEYYGIKEIGIFGSTVRDENSDESDLDILIDLEKPLGLKFFEIKEKLENLTNKKVDLVLKKGLKKALKDRILKEVIYI
jgi:predicted nucleotidyltransferase